MTSRPPASTRPPGRSCGTSSSELVADGTTLLLTTQYLDEADQLADRIAVIDGGKVIAEGTPTELKASVGGQRVLLTLAEAGDAAVAVKALQPFATGSIIPNGSVSGHGGGSWRFPSSPRTGWPRRCSARSTPPASG